MTKVDRIEVGLVSADRGLADFYATVFEMEQLPLIESDVGVVHRLQAPGAVIKVMVPSPSPSVAESVEPFYGVTGLRYLTLYVGDLGAVLERAAAHGGRVAYGPMELGPDARIAVLQDPDGNAVEVLEGRV
jgi:predicted enzyme related to lactoylglutathione lyase